MTSAQNAVSRKSLLNAVQAYVSKRSKSHKCRPPPKDANACLETEDGSPVPHKALQECERICMPCCKKARFPPDCYFPFEKPECKILKPPRPAYSECNKDPVCPLPLCDCCPPKKPVCVLLPTTGKKRKK